LGDAVRRDHRQTAYDAGDDALETVNEVVHGDVPAPPADSPLAGVSAA